MAGVGPEVIIIKKKPKGHAHHGAAWKVAYADFVTAMMALFMVMWLLSQTDKEDREKLAEYFRTGVFDGAPSLLEGGSGLSTEGVVDVKDPAVAMDQVTMVSNVEAVRAALERLVASDPKLKELKELVTARIVPEGLLISITEGEKDVLFDLSSSALKPGLVNLLERLGPVLGKSGLPLQVHGHTDARPFPRGSTRTNWILSFERADQARKQLEAHGVAAGQIVGVHAHGSSKLANAKDPLAAENRRLELLAMRVGEGSGTKAPPRSP